jgi:CheY-like chemotaxis protein
MKKWPFSRKTKILVVDDEGGFTRLLKLAVPQYEIRTENNALRAIAAAEDFGPDMIFLDRYMPGISGDQLAVSIKAHGKLGRVPMAFLTGAVPRMILGGI